MYGDIGGVYCAAFRLGTCCGLGGGEWGERERGSRGVRFDLYLKLIECRHGTLACKVHMKLQE